jgi:Ni2+-binding GTPase involved in maturation of urease and hydrogenase
MPAETPADRANDLCDRALAGDRHALARLLTAVENRTPVAETALRRLYPAAGHAQLVGITGPPGAGKSTLVAALIAELRRAGRPVAVVRGRRWRVYSLDGVARPRRRFVVGDVGRCRHL